MMDKRMIFLVIALLIGLLAWQFFKFGPPPLNAANGINTLEKISLGGLEQWVAIRGENRGAPLLLFIHGGPGSANLDKLRQQTPQLEQNFVVVTYDQRGAGKSALSATGYQDLSIETIASDAHELVQVLKTRFEVEKIYLMGFSWGTQIGLTLAERYPEDFYAYIGVSQVINPAEGERLSLEYVRETALQTGNEKAIAELAGINPAYTSSDWFKQNAAQRKWLLRFGGVYHHAASYTHEAWSLIQAPQYSGMDFALWPGRSTKSLQALWPEIMKVDLTESVHQVSIPVFFFIGRYDQNVPGEICASFFQTLQAPAGKTLVWFEDSAHDLFFDEPQKLTTEILKVLENTR